MMPALRRLALFKQGLASPNHFGEGLDATRSAIEHLGYVQIDTISVVERAHHHVLWNRVPSYKPEHLNHLIRDQQIFEYWYHAASYLPICDYRYALPHMKSIKDGESRYYSGDAKMMREILARIHAEGPLRLRDIDQTGKKTSGDWWNLGPGRRSVEKLFMQGDLMVCERNGMEKTYDLSERCLPQDIDLTPPTLTEYAHYLFDNTLRAHGLFTWKQLLHLKTGTALREAMRKLVDERIEAGLIQAINTESGLKAFADVEALQGLSDKPPTVLKILSPFDNLVIHRDRLSSLFQFDYRIECYVTPAKRRFGYFCLPILLGDRLVGRVDCKAHRSEQRLEVLSLHLEDIDLDQDLFFQAFNQEIQRFAHFNKCLVVDGS